MLLPRERKAFPQLAVWRWMAPGTAQWAGALDRGSVEGCQAGVGVWRIRLPAPEPGEVWSWEPCPRDV